LPSKGSRPAGAVVSASAIRSTSASRSRLLVAALLALASCALLGLAGPSPAAAAGAWLSVQALSEEGHETYVPVVAADSQGTVLAAWEQKEAVGTRIYTSVRPPGGAFAAAVAMSRAGATGQLPAVAFDSSGDAIAVWSGDGVIEASRRPAGGSFGEAQQLSGEGESANDPKVIFDSQGDAVVVWVSDSRVLPEVVRLEASVRPAGGSFGAPRQLDYLTPESMEQNVYISIGGLAADEQGDVFAAWSTSREELYGSEKQSSAIKAAISHAGSAFSEITTLAEKEGTLLSDDVVRSADIAADPQGEALVVWEHYSSTGQKIEAKIRPPEGPFETEPEIVSGEETSVSSPQVAFAGNGEATVVYTAPVGGKTGVVAVLRSVGGEFGLPRPVSESGVSSTYPTVLALANGETLVAWLRYEEPGQINAATRPVGGSFGAPRAVSPTGKGSGIGAPVLAADGYGDAVAIWRRLEANYTAEVAGYDNAGPALQGLSIPTTGTLGQSLGFSVSPLDVWSALGATSWDFGDGSTATGTSATHAYTTAGNFKVTVSSADVLGNLTSESGTVTVSPFIGKGPPPHPPTITHVSESHRVWRRGKRLARLEASVARSHRRPIGTTFSFTLDQDAKVRLLFTSRRSGRRVKGKCVAKTHNNRHKHACTRVVTRGKLAFSGKSGKNQVRFQGRLSRKRRLQPGRYTLVITAANSVGRSEPKRLHFRIVG
jgi:PKD domain